MLTRVDALVDEWLAMHPVKLWMGTARVHRKAQSWGMEYSVHNDKKNFIE